MFKVRYGNFQIVKEMGIDKWDKLNKIMFLQHYGCPTCFMDFTKDPFVALYFGITSIKGSSGTTHNGDGEIINYSDDCYFSVYQINVGTLKTELLINEISDNDDFIKYHEYEVFLNEFSRQSANIGLLLNPNSVENNFNLAKQKGCFLMYDNKNFSFNGRGFEKFIEQYFATRKILPKESIIKIFRIRYNSIFTNRYRGELKKEGLYTFLSKKKINGAYLFNDLQGLKYDFNFFHEN